jgi:hypothetical protein
MNGTWHDDLESAATVDDAVALVRRYLGTLPASALANFSGHCHPRRIKADEDVDDLTSKIAQLRRHASQPPCDEALMSEVFEIVLHASLRTSHLNRARANGISSTRSSAQMSQMH